MGQTIQLVAVIVIVVVAAGYAGRRILGQLTRAEDDPPGCAGCEANPQVQEGRRRKGASGGQIVRIGDRRRR